MKPDYADLKIKFENQKLNFPEEFKLKVYRAISWIKAAESSIDHDSKFLFYWIAFNAAYGGEITQNRFMTNEGKQNIRSEKRVFEEFLKQIIGLDKENNLYTQIWENFSGAFKRLLDNKFVFAPFWEFDQQKISEGHWLAKFESSKKAALAALANQDTLTVLNIIFQRLYVLRNQIIHGNSTWQSSLNRDQVKDGVAILSTIVPVIINLMMDNPELKWAEPLYPPVRD